MILYYIVQFLSNFVERSFLIFVTFHYIITSASFFREYLCKGGDFLEANTSSCCYDINISNCKIGYLIHSKDLAFAQRGLLILLKHNTSFIVYNYITTFWLKCQYFSILFHRNILHFSTLFFLPSLHFLKAFMFNHSNMHL